jgi:cytochrome c oxidase subunit III
MAGTKNHDFHLVNPSPWPLVGALAAGVMAVGAVFSMHGAPWAKYALWGGLLGVLFVMFSWWSDVVKEAETGDHTPVVQLHHRYGMILFIASEVMFFVAWFWAYFNFAVFPGDTVAVAAATGSQWPPKGWTLSICH